MLPEKGWLGLAGAVAGLSDLCSRAGTAGAVTSAKQHYQLSPAQNNVQNTRQHRENKTRPEKTSDTRTAPFLPGPDRDTAGPGGSPSSPQLPLLLLLSGGKGEQCLCPAGARPSPALGRRSPQLKACWPGPSAERCWASRPSVRNKSW